MSTRNHRQFERIAATHRVARHKCLRQMFTLGALSAACCLARPATAQSALAPPDPEPAPVVRTPDAPPADGTTPAQPPDTDTARKLGTNWAEPTEPAPPAPPGPGRPPVKLQAPPAPPPGAPVRASAPELNYDLRLDLPIVVVSYASWSTLQSLNNELAARRCRWCADNAFDRGARDALRWSHGSQKTASTLSDISANALAPAVTVGLSAILAENDRRFSSVPVDIVLTAEAVAAAGVVAQVVKYSVGRIRPDAHALPPSQRPYDGSGNDAYVSFYSGHTSYAFSPAASAGTIASLRQYHGAGWVWATGMGVAALTGYLRVAADKHYLTDVLSSAVASSAIGFSVPYFFHRPVRFLVPVRPSIAPVRGGALLTVDAVL